MKERGRECRAFVRCRNIDKVWYVVVRLKTRLGLMIRDTPQIYEPCDDFPTYTSPRFLNRGSCHVKRFCSWSHTLPIAGLTIGMFTKSNTRAMLYTQLSLIFSRLGATYNISTTKRRRNPSNDGRCTSIWGTLTGID